MSQWKKQLARFGIRRNLNITDAAHILRLFNEADARGVSRIVTWYGKEKTKEQISSYITKSGKFESKDDLLAYIDESDPTPPHISFRDIYPVQTQARNFELQLIPEATAPPWLFPHTQTPQPEFGTSIDETDGEAFQRDFQGYHIWPQIPPQTRTIGFGQQLNAETGSPPWTTVASGQLSSDLSMLHSPLSKSNSSTSLHPKYPSPSNNIERAAAWAIETMEMECDSDDYAEDPSRVEEERQAREQSVHQILATNVHGRSSMVEQLLGREHLEDATQPSEMLFGLLSLTPIAVGRSSMHSREDTENHHHSANEPVPAIAKSNVEGEHFKPKGDSCSFLSHCFSACIWQGQGFQTKADQMMKFAMMNFEDMIVHENDETLTSLSVLVALLEAHGQGDIATSILHQAHSVATGLGDDALTTTIIFMLSALDRSAASACYADRLRGVHKKLEDRFGPMSKSALTAEYNVAWSLTQEAQQQPWKFEEALGILAPLKGKCEVVFGLCHHQTSSCTATLARVYARLENTKAAAYMIEELIRRLEQGLLRFHPYRLQARARHAEYLEELGKLEDAERILREVVRDRFAILGSQNPRSQHSFKRLQKLLRKQDREGEIEGLYQQFETAVDDEYNANQWRAYQFNGVLDL